MCFFFNDAATTEIYTLSLHDALPISLLAGDHDGHAELGLDLQRLLDAAQDRKSTRLNSSHSSISYAVFCLKKKKSARRGGRSGRCCATTSTPATASTRSAVSTARATH